MGAFNNFEHQPNGLTVTMIPKRPQHLEVTNDPYLVDHLQFMQQQEETHYQISHDYLLPHQGAPTTAVSPSDRRTMCSWSYDIVDACSIKREVACIAMSFFDRFMCTTAVSSLATSSAPSPPPSSRRAKTALSSRREFQLAYIACLIIALKCRAGMQVDSDFVSDTICQGLYCEKEIIEMEKEVLVTLQWRLNGPSPHEFIRGLIELLPSKCSSDGAEASGSISEALKKVKREAYMQVEEATLDYSMALRSPSHIAYISLLKVMQNCGQGIFHPLDQLGWMQNIALVTGMKANDILLTSVDHSIVPYGSPSSLTDSISHPYSMCSTTPPDQVTRYHDMPHVMAMMEQNRFSYCSPVSSSSSSVASINTDNHEHLFLDALSMASTESSDFSPAWR